MGATCTKAAQILASPTCRNVSLAAQQSMHVSSSEESVAGCITFMSVCTLDIQKAASRGAWAEIKMGNRRFVDRW